MSMSKLGTSLPSALVCGLMLFIVGAGLGCNGSPKVRAEVEQPEITPPKLVREARGVECCSCSTILYPTWCW